MNCDEPIMNCKGQPMTFAEMGELEDRWWVFKAGKCDDRKCMKCLTGFARLVASEAVKAREKEIADELEDMDVTRPGNFMGDAGGLADLKEFISGLRGEK